MVERPADVLPMDKAHPPKFSTFTRVDMALRRMPGLSFLIVFFLGDWLWSQGNFIALAYLVAASAGTIAVEFWPKR